MLLALCLWFLGLAVACLHPKVVKTLCPSELQAHLAMEIKKMSCCPG